MTTVLDRQALGCGYEPPPLPELGIRIEPWDHPSREPDAGELDENEELVTPVCIGYLMRLPEVAETTRARVHWAKGGLQAWCGTEPPTEALLRSIEELDVSAAQLEQWWITNQSGGK
jgi:hypothetical protein